MDSHNKVPRLLWSSFPETKKDIYNCSILSCYHFIVVFSIVIFTQPWPCDFRDNGFYVFLCFMIYLFVVNVLNCLFLYDEHVENTANNRPFGPVFKLCITIRHVLFWMYGLYVQLAVIYIGVYKMDVGIRLQVNDLYTNRLGFLIWSVICFCIDLHWLIKSYIYYKLTIP